MNFSDNKKRATKVGGVNSDSNTAFLQVSTLMMSSQRLVIEPTVQSCE